jgi:hypothetical protein
MTDTTDVEPQDQLEVLAASTEMMVTEAKVTNARAQKLRAELDELRAAYEIAAIITRSTSISVEFQAYVPQRVKRGNNWVDAPPLGDQAIYNLAVAIVTGSRWGWTPEKSARRIFSIHGKPAIESKDMLELVQKYIERRIANGTSLPSDQGGDDIWPVEESNTKAVWASRRRGREISTEWSMDRAATAGYTSNKLYQTNPVEMLRWKCVAELCRIQWSDVIGGVPYSVEELMEADADSAPIIEQRPVKEGGKGLAGLHEHRARLEAAAADTPPPPAAAEEQGAAAPAADEAPTVEAQRAELAALYQGNGMNERQMLDDLGTVFERKIGALDDLSEQEVAEALAIALANKTAGSATP